MLTIHHDMTVFFQQISYPCTMNRCKSIHLPKWSQSIKSNSNPESNSVTLLKGTHLQRVLTLLIMN